MTHIRFLAICRHSSAAAVAVGAAAACHQAGTNKRLNAPIMFCILCVVLGCDSRVLYLGSCIEFDTHIKCVILLHELIVVVVVGGAACEVPRALSTSRIFLCFVGYQREVLDSKSCKLANTAPPQLAVVSTANTAK